MWRARPSPEADEFQRDDPIEAFLTRPINNRLSAAPNLLEQFVIAEFAHRRRHFCAVTCNVDTLIVELPERSLKHAGAASFCVSEKLRAAPAAGFDIRVHQRSAGRTLTLYCRRFAHRLRSQNSN